MAIFVIGLIEKDKNRVVRLYNDKKNQYRDMKEKDVLFMLDKEDIKLRNAEGKGNKLVGTTGSLEKIVNKSIYVVLGYISDSEDNILGYKLVDTKGKLHNIKLTDCCAFFSNNLIQNASYVHRNTKGFVRGINWDIPCVEKKEKSHNKNDDYIAIDGVLFSKDMRTLVKYPKRKEDSFYKLPDSVEEISALAFLGSTHLTRIDCGISLRRIGESAFADCSKLIIYYRGSKSDWAKIKKSKNWDNNQGTDIGFRPKRIYNYKG